MLVSCNFRYSKVYFENLIPKDEGFVLPDKEPHECVPVSEENFETWDKLLENKESFALMVKSCRVKVF